MIHETLKSQSTGFTFHKGTVRRHHNRPRRPEREIRLLLAEVCLASFAKDLRDLLAKEKKWRNRIGESAEKN